MSLPDIDKSAPRPPKPAEWPSDHLKAVGFRAFLSCPLGEANTLIFAQGVQSSALDGPDVDEDVLASLIGSDEALALLGIEPLHHAFKGFAAAWLVSVAVIIIVADALARIAGSS